MRSDEEKTFASMEELLRAIRSCRLCEEHLPLGPRPVIRASETARILIVGQAPGIRVHETGIPWNDPSGERLRRWLDVDKSTFYDEKRIAIAPMGFCYPGKGTRGDLPPRKECAEAWRVPLHEHLPKLKLVLLIGQYAIAEYLRSRRKRNLAETVAAWREYFPPYCPLPHPSPRNIQWFRRNPWVEDEIVLSIRREFHRILTE